MRDALLPGPIAAVRMTLALIGPVPGAAHAQRFTVRDSAGIPIVTSTAPAWTAAQAPRIDPAPRLVIGTQAGTPYELSRVAGAARLAKGRIVIANGGSQQLRFYDASGGFIKAAGGPGEGPGEFRRLSGLVPLGGETLALRGDRGKVAYFDGDGTLGDLPLSAVVMDGAHPRRPWFAAPLAVAHDDDTFLIGLGTEYAIRVYGRDGRLTRIIRRPWTPVRVTSRDIDTYVVEWGKRWIRSSGPDAERQRADQRDDPYEATVPAYSRFIADRVGRLWVRAANIADAPGAGQLNTTPLVPSVWSVFDRNGAWLDGVRFRRTSSRTTSARTTCSERR